MWPVTQVHYAQTKLGAPCVGPDVNKTVVAVVLENGFCTKVIWFGGGEAKSL